MNGMANERALRIGAQLMRTEAECEQLGLSWETRLQNRVQLERHLAKHDLSWNEVAGYGRKMALL